ncbi:MAG: PKD domain-containing protein [Chitinophagaceae bacterium]
MKSTAAIIFILCLIGLPSYAAHIKGGEVFYEYLGPGTGNNDRFRVTVRLFIDCSSTGAQIDAVANLSIYKNVDNTPVSGSPFTLPNTRDEFLRLSTPSPCILNPSPICYRVRLYSLIIELPKEPGGYTAIYQRCCRINGIQNLSPNNSVGASYTCEIHGTGNLSATEVNSNPQFLVKDTVLICQKRRFTLNFGALDADGDSLSYTFCGAYSGGSTGTPVVTNPPPPSQLNVLNYAAGFAGTRPLGPEVSINPSTGIISGIAPAGGDYVVCVCLTEWRNGKVLSTHRKDFILRVDARCDFAAAELKPAYVTCDGFDFSFQNEAPFSTLIHSYLWDFGVAGRTNDTSTQAKPNFIFPDTGLYKVKLIINPGEECSDSAFTTVGVYPGFFPGFTVNGSCRFNPFLFTDVTNTRYGNVSKWTWNFGDETSTADTSINRNTSWKYNSLGYKQVKLIVESSKGCIDTVIRDSVEVRDKPIVDIAFRDTLICSIDTLQLLARGGGTFSWLPNSSILGANTANPLVFPKATTTYTVTVSDNGCVSSENVLVRVVDFVTLNAGNDTTICLTDAVQFNPDGNGLRYSWAPASSLNNRSVKRPIATPTTNTTYQVTATIGKCNATDDLIIYTVPYPVANAGQDVVICYEDTVQLNGTMMGASFNWSPTNTLTNANSLSPLAFPLLTTPYILSVRDDRGCPKPKLDTILVNVRPKIVADAGSDTSIVSGQPLQLFARGAEFFQWTPPTGLTRTDIQSPVALLNNDVTYFVKVFNQEGCFNYDTMQVKVFKTKPDIFVPNAFTPAKGVNNRFRPIPVGISSIDLFRVYNRWGQLLFSSNDAGKGWDGTFTGKQQDAGAYVWMVGGTDYTGKKVFKKGTIVLIR